ncbi:heme-binding protein [uncultured Roseobacter sp.]|uniref:GlcG/HbpS family heme-binding protein n=1 Tax=uncultured Roseobacter sp. TaxID=114847 RepID=UPI002607BE70|nr:heme-binding protein [uncultured Roseobacter sp.]
MYIANATTLTHAATLAMLQSAVARAEEIGQPQCIVIVDASGVALGQIRMNGAKFLSLKSAESKARTAASIRAPSDAIPEAVGPAIAAATDNHVTRLGGGLPILMNGQCVGGIGVGSGSAEQDVDVAMAALRKIGAETGAFGA